MFVVCIVFVATVSSQLNISNWLFFVVTWAKPMQYTMQLILVFGTNALHQIRMGIHRNHQLGQCLAENFHWFSAYYNLNERRRERTLDSLAFNKRALRCVPMYCYFFSSTLHTPSSSRQWASAPQQWSYVKLIKFILFCAHAIVIMEFVVSSFANHFDCLLSKTESYAITVCWK